MHHAAYRIAVPLAATMAATVSAGALVCCQQILGLDEGTLEGTSSSGSGGGRGGGSASSSVSSSGTASAGGSGGTGGSSTATTGSSSGSTSSSTSGSSSTSATAGSSGSTSSSGAGGSDCVGGVTVTAPNLIDDMEEGSGGIIKQGGRGGSWFTYNDGTDGGVQTPTANGPCLPVAIPGGRCTSEHAMHTFGSGFTNYGMGIGFDLNHPATVRMPYDVSAYTGIAFWARGPQLAVQIQVLEDATTPTAQGGTCPTTSTCADHYAIAVDLGTGWQQIVVPFASLKQATWGTAVPWDPKTVLGVQFAVNPAPAFDFWIDDIGLY
jgi:hypothetical protein